jgi:uncharacterized protein (TIGR02145 family)
MFSKFVSLSLYTSTNNFKKINMEKANPIITVTAVLMFLFSFGNVRDNVSAQATSKSVQTQTKSTQTGSKSVQTKPKSTIPVTKTTQPVQTKPKSTTPVTKSTPSVQTKPKTTTPVTKPTQAKAKPVEKGSVPPPVDKSKDIGIVRIGTQSWALANLNISTFRNGDSIPEAKTNKEWVTAGELGTSAWCYYNNDPANGPKFGKLYNWYAVNDPRGLDPAGWTLPSDEDWAKLMYFLGGPEGSGEKMKNTGGWIDGNHGTNQSGFTGLAGGYRVENGTFLNIGSIGTWWSSTESKSPGAVDYYLSLSRNLGRSSSPRQRGESIRCLRK